MQLKRLTQKQKEAVHAAGYLPDDWQLERETEFYLKIVHRLTGTQRTVDRYRIQKERRKNMIVGCKTIAEYAIKKWLWNNGFVATEFTVEINGNVGTITDKTGDSMTVEYDKETKEVKLKE